MGHDAGLLVIEGTFKSKGKRKVNPSKRANLHLLVKEANPKELFIGAAQEAAFALASSTEDKLDDNLDQAIKANEVMEEVLDLELKTLHPILIDGVEFLFVDDMSHILVLHQDETLFIIAMYASIKDTQNQTAMEDICIGFNFKDVAKSLALPEQHELLVAQTHWCISPSVRNSVKVSQNPILFLTSHSQFPNPKEVAALTLVPQLLGNMMMPQR